MESDRRDPRKNRRRTKQNSLFGLLLFLVSVGTLSVSALRRQLDSGGAAGLVLLLLLFLVSVLRRLDGTRKQVASIFVFGGFSFHHRTRLSCVVSKNELKPFSMVREVVWNRFECCYSGSRLSHRLFHYGYYKKAVDEFRAVDSQSAGLLFL